MQDDVRPIDANALAREIVKLDDLRRLSLKTIGEALDRTPTIDAVPVVRCGECAYKDVPNCCPCQLNGFTVEENWYCPMGVKVEAGASDG